MRAFISVYARTFSLRYVAEERLKDRVTHGTVDKYIRGSEPHYATRQHFQKLYLEEHLKDLPTDPDPETAAIYLIHLLNRIPDEDRRSVYDELVRCLKHAHVRTAADVPPWLEKLADLYDDGPPPHSPRKKPRGPDDEPPEYPRRRRKKS